MLQKSLFKTEQLLDELESDPRRTEPVLWVRRLVILSRLSSDAVVRDIPFRLGLNVIRTKKRVEDESDVVAHSVGKTLVMRLLRYTLGEAAYASGADIKRIQKKLPEGMVCAEWIIAGQLWTVVRPLHEADTECSFVVRGMGWQDVLQSSANHEPLSEFLTLIEGAAFGELPKLQHLKGGPPRWMDALAWIARDSDCGFRKPNYWRDKDLHPPGLRDLNSNKLIMQWLAGLMSEGDATARNQSAKNREIRKELKKEVERREHSLREAYDSLAGRCGFEIPPVDENTKEPPLLDLVDELCGFIAGETRNAEEKLNQLVRSANEEITSLRLREQQQNDQKTAAARDAASARTRRDLLKRLFLDETKKAKRPEQCPAKDSCAWLIQIRQEEAAAEWEEKSQMLEDLQKDIKQAEQKTADAEERERRLAKLAEATGTELESVQSEFGKVRSMLERKVGRWHGLREEAASLSKSADAFSDKVGKQDAAEHESKNVGKRIEHEQSDVSVQESVRRLTNCYLHILTRIFNPEADGVVKIDRNGLMPHPSAELTPNGTAMAVMARVLAFELACVLGSMCGYGHHPRLLMHDSPREGEMESPLFRRLFDILEWMESMSEESTCSFQYIITTTDPPTKFTEDHEKVVLTLHGRSDDGRLLQRKF